MRIASALGSVNQTESGDVVNQIHQHQLLIGCGGNVLLGVVGLFMWYHASPHVRDLSLRFEHCSANWQHWEFVCGLAMLVVGFVSLATAITLFAMGSSLPGVAVLSAAMLTTNFAFCIIYTYGTNHPDASSSIHA